MSHLTTRLIYSALFVSVLLCVFTTTTTYAAPPEVGFTNEPNVSRAYIASPYRQVGFIQPVPDYHPPPPPELAPVPEPPPPPPPPPPGPQDYAWAMLGVPYVWGGASPAGFDCSGLTSWSYAQAGRWLPRTTGAQWAATYRVSDPQPGDLIFFYSDVSHVGIYIGGGQFVHAQNYGEPVQIDTLDGYWSSVLAGFGRL